MGIRGSPTGQPIFDNVRVPAENLIGEENEGFKVAMATLDRSRLGVAAQAVGIAQGATDYAAAYAQERKQFGKPIAAFQGIQFKLADMESRTAAARELLYRACSKVDAGDADMGKYSAMAKLIASDTAMGVTTEAVQVLGGYGYVNEYPVERMMRDAKITQIYEGTNEIQRLVIARTLGRPASKTESPPHTVSRCPPWSDGPRRYTRRSQAPAGVRQEMRQWHRASTLCAMTIVPGAASAMFSLGSSV